MSLHKKGKEKLNPEKLPLWILPLLFIIPPLAAPILNFGGLSVGSFFAFFLMGYFVFANDIITDKLAQKRISFLAISLALMALHVGAWVLSLHGVFQLPQKVALLFSAFYGWFAILTILGLGNYYLNFRNKVTDYLSASSFPVYIFHQTWIIVVAYYILLVIESVPLQMILILVLSSLLTYGTYELFKRVPGIGFWFGIKARSK